MGVEVALVVGAVSGLASAANSAVQGERAARQAKRTGRRQAEALRAEAAAERERGRRQAASARAAFGAAGVGQSGSPLFVASQSFLDNIRTRERILAGADVRQDEANAQADAFRLQGIQGAIGGLSQAINFASNSQFPGFSGASQSASSALSAGSQAVSTGGSGFA